MNYVIRYADEKGRPVRFAFVQCGGDNQALDFARRTMQGRFASVEISREDARHGDAPLTAWRLAS